MEVIDNFDGEYFFLSNFYRMPNGFTNEHLYQSEKTLNTKQRYEILFADTPKRAKRLGRKCIMRPDWDDIKKDVMLELVRLKFEFPQLQTQLLATGETPIVEGNYWHDQVWGNCTCEKHKNVEGQNILGKILMVVREEVQWETTLQGKNDNII